jgi:hypothetical protein
VSVGADVGATKVLAVGPGGSCKTVGVGVGDVVGADVGATDVLAVGPGGSCKTVGVGVGDVVGSAVGVDVGAPVVVPTDVTAVGIAVGVAEGAAEGGAVGNTVGVQVGATVGAKVAAVDVHVLGRDATSAKVVLSNINEPANDIPLASMAVHVTSAGAPCVVSDATVDPDFQAVRSSGQLHVLPPLQQDAVDEFVTHWTVNETPVATVSFGYVKVVPAQPQQGCESVQQTLCE